MNSANDLSTRMFERERRSLFPDISVRTTTREAFSSTPRAKFISRFKISSDLPWIENLSDPAAQLMIQADQSLLIAGDDDEPKSTMSQPSIVWLMLDLLCADPGMVVYEVGSGSGWSTALVASLVGSTGAVYSSEIEDRLAREASLRVANLGLSQVEIRCTPGDFDWAERDADRIIYTTSTFSPWKSTLNRSGFGSRAVFVFQEIGVTDAIISARREGNSFVSEQIVPCYFLPMRECGENSVVRQKQTLSTSQRRLIEGNRHRAFFISDFAHWLQLNWNDLPGTNGLTIRRDRNRNMCVVDSSENSVLLLPDCVDVIGNFRGADIVFSWVRQWMADGAPSVLDYQLTISMPDLVASAPKGSEWRNDWLFVWTRVR